MRYAAWPLKVAASPRDFFATAGSATKERRLENGGAKLSRLTCMKRVESERMKLFTSESNLIRRRAHVDAITPNVATSPPAIDLNRSGDKQIYAPRVGSHTKRIRKK